MCIGNNRTRPNCGTPPQTRMGVEATAPTLFTTATRPFQRWTPPSSSATFSHVSHPSLSSLLSHVCVPLSPFSTARFTPLLATVGEQDECDLGVRFPDQWPRLECAAFYADPTKHYPFTCTSPCELLGYMAHDHAHQDKGQDHGGGN
jgi:hypothetical protein